MVLWGLFGVAGMALRFATSADLMHGLGIAPVFFSGVGQMADRFAERRAHAYANVLVATVGVSVASTPAASR